jgi:serine aminopeptidase S33 family
MRSLPVVGERGPASTLVGRSALEPINPDASASMGRVGTASDPSSRLDPSAGIREEASFFGPGPRKRFGLLSTPVGEPTAGLVICCPYQAEIQRNYRREVLLARRLAQRGVAVQRFHYAGSGHSDGDPSSVTFDSMREDALSAADELVRRTGVTTVGFLGTRWGGLVAASAVASRGGHLCLWEPVVDPARYFDEIFRFLILYELKEDPGSPLAHDASLPDLLRRDGSVDVLGHSVERSLYESSRGLALAELAPDPSHPALLVQIGAGRSLRSEYVRLVDSWKERGLDTQTHVIRDQETWWISGDRWPIHESHPPTSKLIDLTTTWMLERLVGSPHR